MRGMLENVLYARCVSNLRYMRFRLLTGREQRVLPDHSDIKQSNFHNWAAIAASTCGDLSRFLALSTFQLVPLLAWILSIGPQTSDDNTAIVEKLVSLLEVPQNCRKLLVRNPSESSLTRERIIFYSELTGLTRGYARE